MEQLLLFAEQEPPPKEYGPDMGRDPEAELKSMGFPIEIFWVADNPGSYDVPDKPTPMAIIELNGERTMTVWDCVAGVFLS